MNAYFASSLYTLITVLTVMMGGVSVSDAEERLFYKHQEDGGLYIQLQSVDTSATYSVQLVDVQTGDIIADINSFTAGAVPKALKCEWTPKTAIENKACYWNILRNGENISPALPVVEMPEKFHVGNGKIKRGLQSIIWSQDTPAISRVFIANRSGMLISWAKPWGFTAVGAHQEKWSFKDSDSVRSYRTDSNIHAFVQTVPLSKRWIIFGNVDFDEQYAALPLLKNILLPKIPYDFNLSLPGAKLIKGQDGSPDAVYQAHSGMPVSVRLDEESKSKMGGRRFEILLFLNGEFIHEEAQGVDPYTFILPAFPDVQGLHYFTVNIIDYHGNIASKTLAMDFMPAEPKAKQGSTITE